MSRRAGGNRVHPTAIIAENVELGADVTVGAYTVIMDGVRIGPRTNVGPHCLIGENPGDVTIIGDDSIIRSASIIYAGVTTGPRFETGHRVTIRENARFGVNNRIGTLSDVQGDCSFGDYVRLHSNVHVGKLSRVGNYVWLFPYVVLTNDPHP